MIARDSAFKLTFMFLMALFQSVFGQRLHVSPTQNAFNVARNTKIEITFATDINSETLTDNTIKVSGAQSGLHRAAHAIQYNEKTRTATFKTARDFMFGEEVTVMLLTGKIKTKTGTFIEAYTWRFRIKSLAGTGKLTKMLEQKVKGAARSVAAADFNGDGRLDWATTNYDTNTISIFINDQATTVFVGDRPRSLAVLDFDADGDLDLATANANGNRIGIVENLLKDTGSPGFKKGDRPYIGESNAITTGDFDKDGDWDLAVAHRGSAANVSILENEVVDGRRRFKEYASLKLKGVPSAIITGDFNNDGSLDLAVADSLADKVSILKYDHEEKKLTCLFELVASEGKGPTSIASGDFDGDGNLDLAMTSMSSLCILVNDCMGKFKPTNKKVNFRGRVWSVTADNFVGDEKPELVVANRGVVSIYQYDNINQPQDFEVEGNPIAVTSGDFDGDGTPDVAVSIQDQTLGVLRHEVIILRNRPAAPDIDIAPSEHTLDFGSVKQLASDTLEFTIHNEGGADSLKATLSASSPSAFMVAPASPAIPALGAKKIKVIFTPTEIKAYNERLSIISNDPDERVVTVYLQGMGEPFISSTKIAVTPVSPDPDSSVTISANTIAGPKLKSIVLCYRKGGEENFETISPFPADSSSQQWVIPKSAVTSQGLEYYLEARNQNDLTARSDTFPIRVRVNRVVRLDSQRKPVPQFHGSEQTAYRLFSVPLILENKRAENVLEDDLGEYNRKKWRFFEMDSELTAVEFPKTLRLTPGRAFWLIVKNPGKIIDAGPGLSVETHRPYQIPLRRGWNFVANPFTFPAYAADNLSNGKDYKLFYRSGTGWSGELEPKNTILKPFEGYAVHRNKEDTSQSQVYMVVMPHKPAAATHRQLKNRVDEEAVLWKLRIIARCQEAQDTNNWAAAVAGALDGWDQNDQPEPPLVGEYVSVYFPHPEWGRRGYAFSTDARPAPGNGEVWAFEVGTNIRDQVELIFEGLDGVPREFAIWLVDEQLNFSQNLRTSNHYFMAGSELEHHRQLKLVVGNERFVAEKLARSKNVPTTFELSPNFPNPFNPMTTIRYGLPRAERVTLKIYNLLGEEILTLLDNEPKAAGYHLAIWNGRNQGAQLIASGVYLYRLRAGQFTASRKLLLVK